MDLVDDDDTICWILVDLVIFVAEIPLRHVWIGLHAHVTNFLHGKRSLKVVTFKPVKLSLKRN